MKLASLANGTRDGRLVVVNRALTRARPVPGIVATLQGALDDWAEIAPRLAAVYQDLCTNTARNGDLAFEPARCMAPLPRAFHWVDGSAYVNHVELVRKARGAEMPDDFWHDPLVYQGGSDDLLGPCDDILAADVAHGIDLEAEVAVITDDVAMGTPAGEAGAHIKLLMLVNDVSLRNLIPGELGKGFGFYQSKPASAFSPVAITPDELGLAWREDKIHLPLVTHVNGTLLGQPECGEDMTFSFAELIAHVTKTRRLRAGAIVGSGTISNYERSRGSACLAEVRMLETLARGKPETPFLGAGDRVRIEMFNGAGESLFGAIDQVVVIADRT